jgi:hypothetical protein
MIEHIERIKEALRDIGTIVLIAGLCVAAIVVVAAMVGTLVLIEGAARRGGSKWRGERGRGVDRCVGLVVADVAMREREDYSSLHATRCSSASFSPGAR